MIASWREDYDLGLNLARAKRRGAAVPRLRAALAGCRAERAGLDPTSPHRTNLLISESTLLGVLVQTLDLDTDLGVLLDTMAEAVSLQARLADAESLPLAAVALGGVLERRRADLVTDVERIALLDDATEVVGELITVLLELGHPEAALVAAERGRARALVDLIAGSTDGRPDAATEALTAEKIRDAVATHGATVLALWLTDDAGHAWVVCPDRAIEYRALPAGASAVAAAVAALRAPAPGLDPGALRELHALLLAPVLDALPAPGRPVAVVPHRGAHRVPFAALRGADDRPMIMTRPVTLLPSIGALAHTPAGRTGPPRLLALADPRMPPAPDPLTTLTPLPYIRRKLRRFAALMPERPVVRVGDEATFAALRRLAPDADVVLLGTHGWAHDTDPSASYLALAPEAGTHDGLVGIRELTALRWDGRLVLLLACSTGVGRITGDGVLAISRAFLAGGARALVATLWEVGEDTTTRLFYDILAAWLRGTDLAEALRGAQEALYAIDAEHPERWAGVVLYGACAGVELSAP